MEQSPKLIADLILKVSNGDSPAFAKLYHLTSAKLFRVAILILGNPSDAEEALQEVYIKIWRRSGSYKHCEVSPISWLAAIARNQSIDMLRARSPKADDILAMPDLRDASTSPEEACLLSSRRRQVSELIDALDPKTAALVRAAYIEGLSYIELAGEHKTPINTVRTRLRRGLAHLRDAGAMLKRPPVLLTI